MHRLLLQRRAQLPPRLQLHQLPKQHQLLSRLQNPLKLASLPGLKVYSARANQHLQLPCAQQLTARSVMAVATLRNVASNAIHAVNVVSVLKAKESAVMAVVATHAVVVVASVRVTVVQSARLSVVTNHALMHAQKVVTSLVMSHVMKVVVRVQTVAINEMSLV
jgi:hypothetical protein